MAFQNCESENTYTHFSAVFQCPSDKRHTKLTCQVSFTSIRWRETKLGDRSLKIQLMPNNNPCLLKSINLLYNTFLRPDYIISQEALPKILYLIIYYFSNSFLQWNKLSANYVNATWLLLLSMTRYIYGLNERIQVCFWAQDVVAFLPTSQLPAGESTSDILTFAHS